MLRYAEPGPVDIAGVQSTNPQSFHQRSVRRGVPRTYASCGHTIAHALPKHKTR